jgi:DNA-binding transcriptional LysR family regulator
MNLDQLRTFVCVAELASFSRAANALGLGQSTVSFQIRALEESVGAQLLDRAGRGARPTPTGRTLLRYARRMLALEQEALGKVRAEERGESGRVVVAASTIPAEYLLPKLIGSFRPLHPEVTVVVDVSDSRRATAALLAQDAEIAIVGSPPQDSRAESAPLAEDEIVLVGPPDAPASLDRHQLAERPMVLREAGSGTREAAAALLPPESLDGRLATVQVGSTEAARRCVREGLGYTLISRVAVEEDLEAGRLRLVAYPGTPLRRTFHLVRLRAVTPSAAARAFLRHLDEHAAAQGGPRGARATDGEEHADEME